MPVPATTGPGRSASLPSSRLGSAQRPESEAVQQMQAALAGKLDWRDAMSRARPWIEQARHQGAPFWALESLLAEYPISSREGLALMRLAEALLRIPDIETAVALTADQLGSARFDDEQLSSKAIALSRQLLPGQVGERLFGRLGARTVVAAAIRAVQLLGRQFVFGETIEAALAQAAVRRNRRPNLHYSFDMLGEGARNEADAARYLAAYRHAVEAIGRHPHDDPRRTDGMSIKLSALHPRYEAAQAARCLPALHERLWPILEQAARAGMNVAIDAEESDRLELSLAFFDELAARVRRELPGWQGLGLAVQAYQTRALQVVDHVCRLAQRLDQPLMVRLVKGAYWDGEIKRAQELGLAAYPVFTHKAHTDLSFLACASRLLAATPLVYPQFASHNAATVAAILALAAHEPGAGRTPDGQARFELQRLYGMGESVYRGVLDDPDIHCRVYAPVGRQRDLLAYLVRRLLENGANSSFINQLNDPMVPVDALLVAPAPVDGPGSLPLPPACLAPRRNSTGLDLADPSTLAMLVAAVDALAAAPPPAVAELPAAAAEALMDRLAKAQPAWDARGVEARAGCLEASADALEAALPRFCALLVTEAAKTYADALAEVREAVDFLRYYAMRARIDLAPVALPGPTGERNTLRLRGRGVFVAISPWNFPLAIFTGQVAAALACGNTVAAKPAEQTPRIAAAMVALLQANGVPPDALVLAPGAGETIGAALVADPRRAGVVFTGSTPVARTILRALAAGDGPIVPLIAETGGVNAMIVDSSALPEQVTDAVVASAFRSAGQRCSALRLLCVHRAIADATIEMIVGAIACLAVGDPADPTTDVGPLIDRPAADTVRRQIDAACARGRLLAGGSGSVAAADDRAEPCAIDPARFVAPTLIEIDGFDALAGEIFGPVVLLLRYDRDPKVVLARINALGFGLTLGIQTRIDQRADALAAAARVGNVYVNRNMIGAVVGVQPFGGEGLSGTGPKAGGPHYLPRFCAEQTVTINTAAAGGNAELLGGGPAPARSAPL